MKPLFEDVGKLYVPWHNLEPRINIEFAKTSIVEARRLRSDVDKAQAEIYDKIAKNYEDYASDLKDILLFGKAESKHPMNELAEALAGC